MIDVARQIHRCHWRHNDIHAGNFYVHVPGTQTGSNVEARLSEAELYLLDYDNCAKAGIRTPWIKRFFDLGDLRKLYVPGISDEQLLTTYFGTTPAPHWLRIFQFWRHGGFNVRQQLGLDRKLEN